MSEPPAADVLVAHDPRSRRSAEVLASSIERAGLRVQVIDQRAFQALGADPLAILEPVRALVVAVSAPSVDDFLYQLSRASHAVQRPLFVALLNGAEVSVPEKLGVSGSSGVFDFRSGINEDLLASLLEQLRMASGVIPDEFEISKRAPEQQVHLESNAQVSGDKSASPDRGPATAAEAWRRFDDSALEAMGQAYQIARDHRAQGIHTEDMLVGLFRERDGPTAKLLEGAGITEADLAGIVSKEHPTIGLAGDGRPVTLQRTPPRLSRHVSDAIRHALEAVDGSSRISSRELLYGLVALESCSVAKALRNARITPDLVLAWLRTEPAGPLAIPEALAGFQSDTTGGPDLLNIGPEVDAIATVLAARKVDPPLALGLFGDWGTGKTFFMDELDKRIRVLADREAKTDRKGQPRVYCRNIVQLRFNAWHYIDENLWASLANAIFEGLDDALAIQDMNTEEVEVRGKERASLILRRGQVQDRLERRRRCQAEADRRAAQAQVEIDEVDGKYDELVASVQPKAILAAGASVMLEQPEVAEAIRGQVENGVKEAATKAGVEPDRLKERIATRPDGGYIAALRALVDLKGWQLWLPIAGLVLAAIALSAILSALGFDAAALVGVGVTVVVGVVGPLRPVIDGAATIYRVYRDARKKGEQLVEDRRDELHRQATRKKEWRDKVARRVTAGVDKDKEELEQVVKRLTELRPGREMADFVRIRQASNEYKSRLGIVARARDDFEELSRLLARDKKVGDLATAATDGVAGEDSTDGSRVAGPKAIERIVLYIDDLDRCKEKEVVAVLQAVHLLLAFPLFVVVVAVDPRWLLHSLRVESGVFAAKQQGLTDDDEDGLGWEATPLNYLEKIFQIPFALRPMGQSGFGKIINNLVGYEEGAGAADQINGRAQAEAFGSATDVPSEAATGNGSDRPPSDRMGEVNVAEENARPPEDVAESGDSDGAGPVPGKAPDDETRPVEMNPRALDISDAERLYMARMYPLIGTPRGAKRFVNVYKLLKASHPVAEQGDFASPKVHRPVLLLLASLTGFPRETAEILRALVEDKPDGPWWEFVLLFAETAVEDTRSKDPLRSASWEQLIAKLNQVRAGDSTVLRCVDMRERAHRVARYSFESSRILFMEAEDSTTAKPTRKTRTAKAKGPAAKPTATSKA